MSRRDNPDVVLAGAAIAGLAAIALGSLWFGWSRLGVAVPLFVLTLGIAWASESLPQAHSQVALTLNQRRPWLAGAATLGVLFVIVGGAGSGSGPLGIVVPLVVLAIGLVWSLRSPLGTTVNAVDGPTPTPANAGADPRPTGSRIPASNGEPAIDLSEVALPAAAIDPHKSQRRSEAAARFELPDLATGTVMFPQCPQCGEYRLLQIDGTGPRRTGRCQRCTATFDTTRPGATTVRAFWPLDQDELVASPSSTGGADGEPAAHLGESASTRPTTNRPSNKGM